MSGSQRASVGLVADLMLRTRLSEIRRADDRRFDAAIAALGETDVAVANLEMPLSRRGSKILKWSTLRSDPDVIMDVKEMGVDAVSLANNHLMDYGPVALLDTLEACDSAGILRAGAGENLAAALEPIWLDVGGKKVAVVCVASTLPLGSEATEGTPGIAPLRIHFSFEVDTNLINEQPGTVPTVHTWPRAEDQEMILSHIRAVKEIADHVIVKIHWGVPSYWLSPYTGLLAEYQQPLGYALLDAGADVIFGHHSHSLHGIEIYDGKPIFYSGGNFLFHGARGFMEPESLIAQITFGDRLEAAIVPLWIDDRGLPELVTGDEADAVLAKLESLSEPFGTKFERDGDRARVML